MATFDVIYIDPFGKKRKKNIDAYDRDKLITLLKAEGNMPLTVTEQNVLTKEISLDFRKKIMARDYAVFCRQFHSILNAGVTIVNALEMLGKETENKYLADAIVKTRIAVEKGESLTGAMRAQSNVFSPIFLHILEAGEVTGRMEAALQNMAEHFEKEAKMRALIKKATVYPAIVGIVSVLVIAVMLIKIIPDFISMFEEMNTKLPPITTAVVHMSNFIRDYWIFILAFILLIIIGLEIYKATDRGQELMSRISLKLPLLGKLIIKSSAARFGRTLGTLLSAGISITRAMELTAKSMDNVIIKKFLTDSKTEVEKGIPISDTLEPDGMFPPMVSHLIRIGEQTGTTEDMLEKLANYYEEDVENLTQSMMTALEPCMVVVLALVVGFLLLAMFQPMVSMYSGLRNL